MAMAMAAPRCSLLFADSFQHDRLCQHVDEVRFTEPVVITACEVVELHQSSLCASLGLKGTTSPESCAVEIYVRSGGDSRFQRLGPAFLHAPAATSFLDVQAAVTEHLVLRGSYKSLTLVIYGNLASELCLDRNVDADVSSPKGTSQTDHLREVLYAHPTTVSPLSSLHLITPPPAEQRQLLHRLLQCVGGDATQHLVSVLLTAAAAWHLSQQHPGKGAQWCAVKKLDPLDGPVDSQVNDISQDLLELHDWVQQREDEGKQTITEQGGDQALLLLSQRWLEAGLEPSPGLHSPLSAVESLVGGLAAAQLLCNKSPKDVPPFLAAGGMKQLLQVLEEVSGTTALLLFALTAVECACRHGCACEALLSLGKEPLLALLHKMQRPPVTHLLHQILQRLQCYQIAAAFELMVDRLTNVGAAENVVVIKEATKLLNELLDALSVSGSADKSSAQYDLEKTELLTSTVSEKCASVSLDVDPALLSLLQEKRFVSSLAAFSSVPNIWTATGGSPNVCLEYVAVVQRLLLRLLSCRSGLLFLSGDTEAAAAIVSSLRKSSGQESEVSPIRHAAVLTSQGFLCAPRDLAGMIQSRISVMSAADRLVGANKASEAAFWALWDLAAIARTEAGRQAVLSVVWFPEVLNSLIESLQFAPEPAQAVGGAAGHFAAEVLQKVFCDAALTNQMALTVHASALQTALQAAYNSGMSNCSRILEWVEAAVVYEKKGAIGLLKHVAALIGPQTTSATMHVDGSMDDDANNLRDRAPGAELPTALSKRTMTALIQDSAVHALTISLKLLASSAWNPGVAALLYGEGAMGVVNAVLEHCVVALQVSSNDYDDEEAEEEEGRGEDQHKERVLLALLLPTLLLLLSLLKRLQAVVQQNCSTRLLDLLLRLHHVVSAKAGAYGTVPPYAWTGGVLEVGAVQQVLASLLAFWPIFGWTPALLPRLLGPNSTSLPVEPGEACSVICLLEECLLPESPRLYLNKAAVVDVYRSIAVGSMYGLDVMSAVQWHTSLPNTEKMLHVLYPHLEQLGQLILRLAPSTCDVVQERLTSLVTRFACQSVEQASILVRPVLLLLQQRTAAASRSSLSEIDVQQVERMLQWVALLAVHPSSKAVLLQEGAVQVLVQALSLATTSSPPAASVKLGWLCWSCKAVAPICDPAISFLPVTSMDRHIAEDCPDYDDCCAIASSLLPLFQGMPVEKHMKVFAVALEKLASHDLGRAALASVALGQPGNAPPMTNPDQANPEPSWVFYQDSPPLLKLWQKFVAALDSNDNLKPVHVELIRHFAIAASVLSDSGQSAYGVGALKAMFGLSLVAETTGMGDAGENLQPILRVASTLQQHITPLGGSGLSSSVPVASLQEAHTAVSAMLNVLKAPAKLFSLHEEIESLVGRLPAPRPIAERRAEALTVQGSSSWRILSPSIPVEETDTTDAEMSDPSNSDVRGTIPWDCPRLLQERPVMAMGMSKRRVISTIEVASKRQRGEGAAAAIAVASRTTVVVTSNRRDTFRQRKPNTSRPPSMHVDDYVAREKSTDALPGGSPATTAPPLQRSNSSAGRPPSIHVDEFMARQRERQQPAAPSIVHPFAENGDTRTGFDNPELADDGPILALTEGISHISRVTSEYSSLSVVISGVTSFSTNVTAPPALGALPNSAAPSGPSTGLAPPHSQPFTKPHQPLQRNASSLSTSAASELATFASQRMEGSKKELHNGASPRVEINNPPPVSPAAVKVKLERAAPAASNVLAGPPLAPSRPFKQEDNTVGSAWVKTEPRPQQLDRSKSVRSSPREAPAVLSSGTPQSTLSQQRPLPSEMSPNLAPPPPPGPPSGWLDPVRRLDSPLLQPGMPMHMMNAGTFAPASRPADLQVGGAVLQPPGGMWREPPPMLTSLPPPAPPAPSPIQHGPPFVQQPYGASRPLDNLQGFPVTHTSAASSSERRYGNFGSPMPGPGLGPLPPPFQPPVPVGLPPPNVLQSQQLVHHPPPLRLQEAEISAQQEPGAVLQQILASPDTIQELLKDPKKLQQLLEQHPKLITLLQEKMSHGTL